MLPKSRPSFRNPEVLSITEVEQSRPASPWINGLRGDLGPNETCGSWGWRPGARRRGVAPHQTRNRPGPSTTTIPSHERGWRPAPAPFVSVQKGTTMTAPSTVLLGLAPQPTPTPSTTGTQLPGPSQWLSDTVTAAVAWCVHRPWLAVVAASIVVAAVAVRAVIARGRQRAMARHATVVRITPPPEVDAAGTAAF